MYQILLVEDNADDVELTLRAFRKSDLVNTVTVARDGVEALDYLYRRNQYAGRPASHPLIILLDLKMPRVDGLEVLRQIKHDAGLRFIPIVMLTSSREEQDIVESYNLGANAYVVKPVAFEAFVGVVKQIGLFWILINEPPARHSM